KSTLFPYTTLFRSDIKEAFDARPDDLLEYDGFLIGTYTWEGGEIPDEFMFFYEELDSFDLTEKKAAVFGSGDSYYRFTFGAALNLFADKIQSCGATITVPTLRSEERRVGKECRSQ